MRKNFKPHAKQNKIASSFRKKTIDPGVDLNLKKDDDNMENIDEFWDMAEYVMNDDQNLTKETNVTKDKNLNNATKLANEVLKKTQRKEIFDNVESSVLNDVMDISTEGSKITSDNKQTPNKQLNQTNKENEQSEDTLFDINNIRESLSHTTFKKMSNVSNTSGFDTNLQVESINENFNVSNTEGMFKGKNKQKVKSKKKEAKEVNKDISKNKVTNVKESKANESNKTKLENLKMQKSNKTKIEDLTKTKSKYEVKNDASNRKRSSVVALTTYKGEPLIGKNNKVYGMTKISSLYQGKSKIEPLITKKSLESGILFLQQGASILQETADNPFTLLLLKGTIEISINNELYKLNRDSCMFVDEGSSYNIIDKSRDGSSLFITFKAK